ncbi:MAG: Rap1a/Tai family immunity protein [Pseudomonadota bacterium]
MSAIAGIALCLSPGGSRAEGFWDGNKLYAECRKPTKLCDAYLAGLADMAAKEAGVALPSAAICFPEGTSVRQLREAVLKQLEDYPQGRGEPAVYIALTAIKEAWPCSK